MWGNIFINFNVLRFRGEYVDLVLEEMTRFWDSEGVGVNAFKLIIVFICTIPAFFFSEK